MSTIPTLEQIRFNYVSGCCTEDDTAKEWKAAGERFDRWLAGHDQERDDLGNLAAEYRRRADETDAKLAAAIEKVNHYRRAAAALEDRAINAEIEVQRLRAAITRVRSILLSPTTNSAGTFASELDSISQLYDDGVAYLLRCAIDEEGQTAAPEPLDLSPAEIDEFLAPLEDPAGGDQP